MHCFYRKTIDPNQPKNILNSLFCVVLLAYCFGVAALGCAPEPSSPARTTASTVKEPPRQPERSAHKSTHKPVQVVHRLSKAETKTLEALSDGMAPELALELKSSGTDDVREQLKTADIVQVRLSHLPELVNAGLLTDVSAHIELLSQPKTIRNLIAYDGRIYAHPDRLECHVLYINRKMLDASGEQPPSTLPELVRIARKLTLDSNGYHSLHPLFEDKVIKRHGLFVRSEANSFLPLVHAMGGGVLTVESGEVHIDGPRSIEAGRLLQGLRGRYGIVPGWLDAPTAMDTAADLFTAGKIAMMIDSSTRVNALLNEGAFRDRDNLIIVPLPVGPEGRGGCLIDGFGYVVTLRGKSHPHAHAVAKWLADEQVQATMASKHRVPPTLYPVQKKTTPRSDPLLYALNAAGAFGSGRPVFPGLARLPDALDPALIKVAKGADPSNLFKKVADDWRVLLAEMARVHRP